MKHTHNLLIITWITEALDRGECLIGVFLDFLKHSIR